MFHKPKTFYWSHMKKENIIEMQARKKKEIPASNLYSSIVDWGKSSNKGKFTKSDRKTLIDQILALKKLKLPGPGTYEALKLEVKQPYVK